LPKERDFLVIARCFHVFLLVLLGTGPVSASETQTLDWDDLLPKMTQMKSSYLDLPQDQQFDVESLADLLWFQANGKYQDDPNIAQDIKDFTDQLTEQGVDIEKAVKDYEAYRDELVKRSKAVKPELNGRDVRLPGYALPLEFDGSAVTEFLLVPYLGACIHTPPPPPNQIVFVRVDEPFQMKDIYEPVWVTGRMSTGLAEKNLSYVDGETKIKTGYSLNGRKIEPYLSDAK